MDVPMEHLQRVPRPSPAASSQDRSPLCLMDRISRAKNRMRQSRSSGTVGGEGGNLLAYPAAGSIARIGADELEGTIVEAIRRAFPDEQVPSRDRRDLRDQ